MKAGLTVILMLLIVESALAISLKSHDDSIAEFCWRDSYGRGVGSIPTECGDLEKIGLLCYPKCPEGYSRFGFDCHQNCPDSAEGWADQGLFCRLTEYGRGAGYAWYPSDGFSSSGMFARC